MNTVRTLDEAITYLEKFLPSVSKVTRSKEEKLTSIQTLLSLCKNPHKNIKIIHVAGSKGKSTITRAVGIFLRSFGYKTGIFTSPHIHSYNERICIDGKSISNALFLKALRFIYTRIEENHANVPLQPTVFEILTVAAFLAFYESSCDWAVIEVGIGGRYDTTNIVSPELCIISEIEYEHTDILGNSIEEIAYDKAGIIKPHIPVWIHNQPYEKAFSILKQTAQQLHSPFHSIKKFCTIENIHTSLEGTSADIIATTHGESWSVHYKTPTIGKVLLENQILAYVAIRHLLKDTYKKNHRVLSMPNDIILPARCELLRQNPYIFLDGAHTRHSIEQACMCIEYLFSRSCLVFGMIDNKDYKNACKILSKYKHIFSYVIVTRPGTFKNSNIKTIHQEVSTYFPKAELITTEEHAMQRAMEITSDAHFQTSTISVLGSFYLCSACREFCMQKEV